MSLDKTYAGFFEAAHRSITFDFEAPEEDTERRRRERRNFPTVQSVAAYINGMIPPKERLEPVECNDISTGGMSFFASGPPTFDRLVVALSTATEMIYLSAAVAHYSFVGDAQNPRYLIGCRFLGRVQL